MARTSSLTASVTEKVCEALKLGVSFAAAAAHAGVSASTLSDWRRRGADGEAPFDQFRESTDRARGQFEVRAAAMVMKSAQDGDGSAARYLIEHRATDTGDSPASERPSASAILAKLAGG